MQSITVGTLLILDYRGGQGDENEDNIGEVNESFISTKGNLGILKKLERSCRKIALTE